MIRVLVVEDSKGMQKSLIASMALSKEIQVIDCAADAFEARDKIVALRPDVITLDIEMPRMDGLTFLRQLMQYFPMPVIVVSSFAQQNSIYSIRALEYGATDVLCKPDSHEETEIFSKILCYKIHAAALISFKQVRQQMMEEEDERPPVKRTISNASDKVLAIGASTGGVKALYNIVKRLPPTTPGTVIVQHLPRQFTQTFAKRLNQQCDLEVREAKGKETLRPGLVLIAPGDKHMTLKKIGNSYMTQLKMGPKVYFQRPSVEVLFVSVAREAGSKAVGVILTGMGEDGATGLLEMRQAGAYTIAQDRESSVVYGMPQAAAAVNAAQMVAPLHAIPERIVEGFRKKRESVRSQSAACGDVGVG